MIGLDTNNEVHQAVARMLICIFGLGGALVFLYATKQAGVPLERRWLALAIAPTVSLLAAIVAVTLVSAGTVVITRVIKLKPWLPIILFVACPIAAMTVSAIGIAGILCGNTDTTDGTIWLLTVCLGAISIGETSLVETRLNAMFDALDGR